MWYSSKSGDFAQQGDVLIFLLLMLHIAHNIYLMHQLIQFKKIKEDELQKFSPGIHEEVKKFYPLGLKKEQADYNKSPGIKKINSIIQDNILNAENFRSRWTEGFHHDLAKALHLDVKGATKRPGPLYWRYYFYG
ncbi:hypothetical protein LZ575_16765 [Antarcticibacterium sp. 1MA-6-2]|uniref:hypothetical protein n=1 Tax=Antarcticibacterium sp. 1MA-6-2 TaxID=2908210 RepID=UPI001F26494D|nr:hypothetical protein [Antarcticibacterium sp. 1MA-6-2]UJH90455.1 hypothetical protein LZ575_16765 [Antarcticibacterium sp. 1MA-6-2]